MDKELWVVDRVEDGERAVLVRGTGEEERTVGRSDLPPGAGEGTALRSVEEAGAVRYIVDEEATERLRARAKGLRDSLRRGRSGPLSL